MTSDYRSFNQQLEDVFYPMPLSLDDMKYWLKGKIRFGKDDGRRCYWQITVTVESGQITAIGASYWSEGLEKYEEFGVLSHINAVLPLLFVFQ